MNDLSKWLLACVLFAAGAHAGTARAEENPSVDSAGKPGAAEAHFYAGRALYDGGQFAAALGEFRASFAVTRSPNLALYIARCLREIGDPAGAYDTYAEAIVLAADRVGSWKYVATQAAASEERAALRAKVATVVLAVPAGVAGASVVVAEKPIDAAQWGKDMTVAAGNVRVHAEAPGRVSFDRTVELTAGESRRIDIDLEEAKAEPKVVAAAEKTVSPKPDDSIRKGTVLAPIPQPPQSFFRPLRSAAIVSAGVGVAGVAVAGIFGVAASNRYAELRQQCIPRCPASLQGEVDGGRTQSTISKVGIVFGAAGFAGSAALLAIDWKRQRATNLAWALTPGGITCTGAF